LCKKVCCNYYTFIHIYIYIYYSGGSKNFEKGAHTSGRELWLISYIVYQTSFTGTISQSNLLCWRMTICYQYSHLISQTFLVFHIVRKYLRVRGENPKDLIYRLLLSLSLKAKNKPMLPQFWSTNNAWNIGVTYLKVYQ
jgi:hypothetical protein